MWEIMSRIRNLSSGAPLQAPEMTTAEIHALTSVEDGMIVYNTDTRQLLTHVAGSWLAISNSGSSGTVTNVDTGIGLTGGPITGAGKIELADTAVVAGEYIAANITVDAQGRIVSATSGDIGIVDSVVGTEGQINVNSDDPTHPVVSLADTAVVAGEYIAANITVDAQGRIVSATSGDIGIVDSVVGTEGQINVNSDDPTHPVVSLADTGVTAGSYNMSNITVDATGRVSAVSSSTPATTTEYALATWGKTDGSNLVDNAGTQVDDDGNITTIGSVTASEFKSTGNINIDKSGKLRIASPNQGVLEINANPNLTDQCNISFGSSLSFPTELPLEGQTFVGDNLGNLSWQSIIASVHSHAGTIAVDSSDPMNVNIDLPITGITAGTYSSPSLITFDDYGRATAVTSGNSTSHGMIVLTSGSGDLSAYLPVGVTAGKVTVIGGGGYGGNTITTNSIGSGGGAGGTAIRYVTDLSSSSTYSVGLAGQSSTLITNSILMRGNPGGNGAVATTSTIVAGGAGGTATGGSINIPGQNGANVSTSSTVGSGAGANSFFNGGGKAVIVLGNGIAASANSGCGGSGAYKSATGIGGAGAAGIIIIEY